jgi:CXXX repeat peptide maturase
MAALKHLIVMLGGMSVPFCHEPEPRRDDASWLPIASLRRAVLLALKSNSKINFLYPAKKPTRDYERLIEEVDHVKIVPFDLHRAYPEAIVVIESRAFPGSAGLRSLRGRNVILRLERADLPMLSARLSPLLPIGRRINIVLKDLAAFGDETWGEYRRQLGFLRRALLRIPDRAGIPEVNALTDRISLARMNNCEAGLTHLTVAPNGLMYLCPAFYRQDDAETLGEIRADIVIPNRHLLELKYAPICRICDAYQCRRCVFLNRALTLEVNTPSFQQCRASHIEREASRLLMSANRTGIRRFPGSVRIAKIAYDDPFEIVEARRLSIAEFKKM